jgi:hypothetical protein
MNIYVATKWENAERAKEVAAALEAAGHRITYKWWDSSVADATQAWNDFAGVKWADALVLIVEKDFRYSGALTEFGIALGAGVPVYLLGHALDVNNVHASMPNIFTLLPQVHRGIETLLQATHTTL